MADKRKVPELLAPAGDWERLRMAVLYGADAVYLAGTAFGMRAFAGEHDVQHHKVRALLLDGLPEGTAVPEAPGGETRRLQGVDLDIPDAAVVFHTPDHR